MINLNIKEAHHLVSQQRSLGADCRWEGWDIVFFRPAEHAIHSKSGAFRDGTWGFDNRVVVNSEGKWEIDSRNIKRVRRSGNRPRKR